MRSAKLRSRAALFTLALGLVALQGCATKHLLRWSEGSDSIWSQPTEDHAPYVRPAGAVLAFPITLVWDIATFPFQWLWGAYPYGPDLQPEGQEPSTDG